MRETLLKLTEDEGSRKALHFPATREVAQTRMFMETLKSVDRATGPSFGDFEPDSSVDVYFNVSSGSGAVLRGPWNSDPAFQCASNPLEHERLDQAGRPAATRRGMIGNRRTDTGSGPGWRGINLIPDR